MATIRVTRHVSQYADVVVPYDQDEYIEWAGGEQASVEDFIRSDRHWPYNLPEIDWVDREDSWIEIEL